MLFHDLKKENVVAMKNKDAIARSILSVVINKCMLVEVEKRTKGEELVDADVVQVLQKTMKELEEEKENYAKVGNFQEVETLEKQKLFLNKFLPKMLSVEEIKEEISKLTDKTIPSIMKHFKTNFTGKCDMREVNKIAQELQK